MDTAKMEIVVKPYKDEYAEVHYQAVKASLTSLQKWFRFAKPDYCCHDSEEFIKSQSEKRDKVR